MTQLSEYETNELLEELKRRGVTYEEIGLKWNAIKNKTTQIELGQTVMTNFKKEK
jgi:hypothetical protein